MDIYLHRYKIHQDWINKVKIGCFYIKPEVADFFLSKTEKNYTKHFSISDVSGFAYDIFNEIDYITFNQNAILGNEPIMYSETDVKDYKRAIEKQLSEMLSYSMRYDWAEFVRTQDSILDYKEIYLQDVEDEYIHNKILTIRIGKDFIRNKLDRALISKYLREFADEYNIFFDQMPLKYKILRFNSQVELISEVVKQQQQGGRDKGERYFSYRQIIDVIKIKDDYYLNLENGLKKYLVKLKNSKGDIYFYRDNRNILFTQNGENGISLSAATLTKKSRKKLQFHRRRTEEYAKYVGLYDDLLSYEKDPEQFLKGETRFYLPYQPEDIKRLDRDAVKNGSGLTERFFEYLMYQGKVNYLSPVNKDMQKIPFKWKRAQDKSGYRTLTMLEQSKLNLKDLKVFQLGIIGKNNEDIEKVIDKVFEKVSHKPDKAKKSYVQFEKYAENKYYVTMYPEDEQIFKIELHFLEWNDEVFGDLSDDEIENNILRQNKIQKWLTKQSFHGLLVETRNYPLSNEKIDRDPKWLIRRELIRNKVINQFMFDDHSDWENIIIQSVCEILSRIGFVQSVYYRKKEDHLRKFIFINILSVKGEKNKIEGYHLICSQITDRETGFLINNSNSMKSIDKCFLEEDLTEVFNHSLKFDEVKAILARLSNYSKEKIWIFPKTHKELLPEIENVMLYEPAVKITTSIKEKNKKALGKAAVAFGHIPREVFIVPSKLNTDDAKYADVTRQNSNYKPLLVRSKLRLEVPEHLYEEVDPLHFLMYINAQFTSSTNLPYPLHSMKYFKEVVEALSLSKKEMVKP
ncbi:hypothetical protein [Priestia aryabhattai]